jgi:hypothetical protein
MTGTTGDHDLDRLHELTRAFRPGSPITHQDLFSGRAGELVRVMDAVERPGQHGVIFGERGVGKTSLAAVSAEITGRNRLAMRINSDGGDDFQSLWQKVVDELAIEIRTRMGGGRPEGYTEAVTDAVEILSYDEANPGRVRQALEVIGRVTPVLIFFDEFDRIDDPDARVLMADTIKGLSDQLADATLVLVGVADDVDALTESHESIARSVVQIRMPRMTPEELGAIVQKGLTRVELAIKESALHYLMHLPQGLPHFVHLLTQKAAEQAILDGSDSVTSDDLRVAVREAVESSDESMTRAYTVATTSSHKTIFEPVLLACALAPVDPLGFFAPGDLRAPLRKITGEEYSIDRFQSHLVKFIQPVRGPVLERRGGERRWRYRFVNPMMRPFVVMRALTNGIDADVLGIAPPTERETLF